MATYVSSTEAARILGVRPQTLYAYVSRGLLERRVGPDGRRSLYDRADVDRLASRGRNRTSPPRPSIDVQVASSVTSLDEAGPSYRGAPVVELVGRSTFEQAAELLWSGNLPDSPPTWPAPTADELHLVAAAVDAVGEPGLGVLTAVCSALAQRLPAESPIEASRRLLTIAPAAVTGRDGGTGSMAQRLVRAWTGRTDEGIVRSVDAALVTLADHELTTSTLAARVAASVRPPAFAALGAGLSTLSGRLHGGAAGEVAALLLDARENGAERALDRSAAGSGGPPGFGHSIYRQQDPRFAPLLETLAAFPDPAGWSDTVAELIVVAGRRVPAPPNVDLALGALLVTAGLPADAPLFAVARIAGLGAHVAEEMDESPLRFRGLTRSARH